jgi:Uma2 family endonuclease
MPPTFTPVFETMADVLEQLGDIDPRRVRLNPPPGKATENDLLRLHQQTKRLYELVDGTLVEKIMGFPESYLACELIKLVGAFVDQHDLGFVVGEAAAMRLMPGLVRVPDLSFISWDLVPVRGQVPDQAIPKLAPNLAVEVLSRRNTPREMERKLKEYFLSGVRLVWFVDPRQRTVTVFTSPDQSTILTEQQTLTGGDVLPGLVVPLARLFRPTPRRQAKPSKATKTKTTKPNNKKKP